MRGLYATELSVSSKKEFRVVMGYRSEVLPHDPNEGISWIGLCGTTDLPLLIRLDAAKNSLRVYWKVYRDDSDDKDSTGRTAS